jgi:hypothetical protein
MAAAPPAKGMDTQSDLPPSTQQRMRPILEEGNAAGLTRWHAANLVTLSPCKAGTTLDQQVRLRVTPSFHELDEVRLAVLKLGVR